MRGKKVVIPEKLWNQTIQLAYEGDHMRVTRDELWIMGQLVMREKKVIMPEKLWNQTIQLAYQGHQGLVRTKSLLREKEWSDLAKQSEPAIHANRLDPDQSQNQ